MKIVALDQSWKQQMRLQTAKQIIMMKNRSLVLPMKMKVSGKIYIVLSLIYLRNFCNSAHILIFEISTSFPVQLKTEDSQFSHKTMIVIQLVNKDFFCSEFDDKLKQNLLLFSDVFLMRNVVGSSM